MSFRKDRVFVYVYTWNVHMSCGSPQLLWQLTARLYRKMLLQLESGENSEQKEKNCFEHKIEHRPHQQSRSQQQQCRRSKKKRSLSFSSSGRMRKNGQNLFYIYRLVWWNKLKIKRFLPFFVQFFVGEINFRIFAEQKTPRGCTYRYIAKRKTEGKIAEENRFSRFGK